MRLDTWGSGAGEQGGGFNLQGNGGRAGAILKAKGFKFSMHEHGIDGERTNREYRRVIERDNTEREEEVIHPKIHLGSGMGESYKCVSLKGAGKRLASLKSQWWLKRCKVTMEKLRVERGHKEGRKKPQSIRTDGRGDSLLRT